MARPVLSADAVELTGVEFLVVELVELVVLTLTVVLVGVVVAGVAGVVVVVVDEELPVLALALGSPPAAVM